MSEICDGCKQERLPAEYLCSVCAVERDALRAEVKRLRDALTACIHAHDGTHDDDCHAFGSGLDDADLSDEGPDPSCDCGAQDKRDAARAALATKEGT